MVLSWFLWRYVHRVFVFRPTHSPAPIRRRPTWTHRISLVVVCSVFFATLVAQQASGLYINNKTQEGRERERERQKCQCVGRVLAALKRVQEPWFNVHWWCGGCCWKVCKGVAWFDFRCDNEGSDLCVSCPAGQTIAKLNGSQWLHSPLKYTSVTLKCYRRKRKSKKNSIFMLIRKFAVLQFMMPCCTSFSHRRTFSKAVETFGSTFLHQKLSMIHKPNLPPFFKEFSFQKTFQKCRNLQDYSLSTQQEQLFSVPDQYNY